MVCFQFWQSGTVFEDCSYECNGGKAVRKFRTSARVLSTAPAVTEVFLGDHEIVR